VNFDISVSIQKTITTSISPSNSFTSGISSTSTPVSRKSTVEQIKPKQKNQLKLRDNQKKTGNVLNIGNSITKDINRASLITWLLLFEDFLFHPTEF
jgi:hypothetical protein